jgi:hypothetical protein
MRQHVSTIRPAFVPTKPAQSTLNYVLLQRYFLVLGAVLVLISPYSRDPMAFALGGLAPWAILHLIGRPNMPAAVVFFLLLQWLQAFARVIQSLVDGETLAGGLYGPTVEQAYWYTLAGVLVLAASFRLVLGGLRAPAPEYALVHREWHLRDLCVLYGVSLVVAAACAYGALGVSSLDQPLQAAGDVKVLVLMMLFATVLSTGKGFNILFAVLLVEIFIGFTGLFASFKSVFFYLAISALAVRVRWNAIMAIGSVALVSALVGMAIFWTAVKGEYREFATGAPESQSIRTTLSSRIGYLGERATSVEALDWGFASYALLVRLAYVDIFGSVIGVNEVSPEPGYMRQWQDAAEHVIKPRFLFPEKPGLSDTDVFVRLAHADSSELLRAGTSISVGYMAENFVDLGFPGMLVGIFMLGTMAACICWYFMTRPLPWMVREGAVLAVLYNIGHDGVEISLPKILGAMLMTFAIWAIMAKWLFVPVVRWLGRGQA